MRILRSALIVQLGLIMPTLAGAQLIDPNQRCAYGTDPNNCQPITPSPYVPGPYAVQPDPAPYQPLPSQTYAVCASTAVPGTHNAFVTNAIPQNGAGGDIAAMLDHYAAQQNYNVSFSCQMANSLAEANMLIQNMTINMVNRGLSVSQVRYRGG